uniref:Uncharacterized protein n=1 Tax=Anguilla anguilla TaxID=7936 RepID=A0A0E9T3X1_ANGAN
MSNYLQPLAVFMCKPRCQFRRAKTFAVLLLNTWCRQSALFTQQPTAKLAQSGVRGRTFTCCFGT